MIKVIGVRFRKAGKVYYFDPAQMEIKMGDHVIVETARGIEFGEVVLGVREVDEKKVIQPLKSVIRMATKNDEELERKNKEKEHEAFQICQEKIRKHELQMKLIDAEYTFDNNKLLFYFTADGRIDFRQLVKDLAAVFKTRIELRQIGVRDETKILGGVGICGRPLCCHSYLSEFIPVSIKMAKEQNLSLNPTKISGVCGRLMCCLKYEEETYEDLNSHLPSVGDYVTTDDGLKGEVHSVSVLRQQVKVVVTVGRDEKEIRDYRVDQLKFKPKRRRDRGNVNDAELKALEALEKKEGKNPILSYLADSEADIICLQEYNSTKNKKYLTDEDIRKALKAYPYRSIHNPEKGGSQLACFSKFPILSARPIKYESTYNGSMQYTLKVNEDTITLINNHLESNKLTKEDKVIYEDMIKDPNAKKVKTGLRQLIKKLAEASAIRSSQADSVAVAIANSKYPTIIACGDFNDASISYTHRILTQQLDDAFTQSGRGLGISYNLNKFYFRIDNILISPNQKAYNCTVDRSIKDSDHYPIWCYIGKQ